MEPKLTENTEAIPPVPARAERKTPKAGAPTGTRSTKGAWVVYEQQPINDGGAVQVIPGLVTPDELEARTEAMDGDHVDPAFVVFVPWGESMMSCIGNDRVKRSNAAQARAAK